MCLSVWLINEWALIFLRKAPLKLKCTFKFKASHSPPDFIFQYLQLNSFQGHNRTDHKCSQHYPLDNVLLHVLNVLEGEVTVDVDHACLGFVIASVLFYHTIFSIHNVLHHGTPHVYASTFCRLPANQNKWTHGCSRFVVVDINLQANSNYDHCSLRFRYFRSRYFEHSFLVIVCRLFILVWW